MADLTSGDRPVASTNGAVAGQQDSIAPSSSPLDERARSMIDRAITQRELDRPAPEQSGGADGGAPDGGRDRLTGGVSDQDDVAREARERGARRRHEAAQARVDAAVARDALAAARDLAAVARDREAADRDRELAARDAVAMGDGRAMTGAEVLLRAAENRSAAAANRSVATESRARSAADREQAARDREQAARDREQAQADRDALLQQLAIAETDALTGTRTRAAGLADLDREVDRARRMRGRLVIAIVDVVGVDAGSDAPRPNAGDALLQKAVREIRGHLRSYDLIVRLGGHEFLCVMSEATVAIASRRFDAVAAALAANPERGEIRVGFAALEAAESARELVQRADCDLPSRLPPHAVNAMVSTALPRSPHVYRSRGA